MKSLRQVIVCGALWAAACGTSPELPRIMEPDPILDADDHAVMKATLDHLRPFRDDSIRRGWLPRTPPGTIDARFLVFDGTTPACVGDPRLFYPRLPGCVGGDWLRHLSVRQGSLSAALEIFKHRNARSLPIRGDLGPDVVLVPAGTDRIADLGPLAASHPSGSQIVSFSAPAYLDGTAVMAYRTFWDSGGFVRVERNGTHWKVADRSGWVE